MVWICLNGVYGWRCNITSPWPFVATLQTYELLIVVYRVAKWVLEFKAGIVALGTDSFMVDNEWTNLHSGATGVSHLSC